MHIDVCTWCSYIVSDLYCSVVLWQIFFLLGMLVVGPSAGQYSNFSISIFVRQDITIFNIITILLTPQY